jgi:Na+/phosphate symporter
MTKLIESITTDLAPIGTKFNVTDPASLTKATEVLSQMNKLLDALIEDREKITKPINQSLKEIRAKYKPVQDALELRIATLKQSITEYATATEKASQLAADRLSARVGVNLSLETAASRIEALPTVDKKVETAEGSVQFVTVKKFEVVDISLLPVDCILPNEVVIRKKMLAGEEVKGVRYFEEKSIRNQR